MNKKRTWVFWLNFLFLQIFWIRLARVFDTDTDSQIGWTILRKPPFAGWTKDGIGEI